MEREQLQAKPDPLGYPRSASKYRFYGNNIQIMIDTALTWDDGDMKDALVYAIANHMKKCYLNWNKDTVDDDVIFSHLEELSGGKLMVKDKEPLAEAKNLLKQKMSKNFSKATQKQGKKNYRKRG